MSWFVEYVAHKAPLRQEGTARINEPTQHIRRGRRRIGPLNQFRETRDVALLGLNEFSDLAHERRRWPRGCTRHWCVAHWAVWALCDGNTDSEKQHDSHAPRNLRR